MARSGHDTSQPTELESAVLGIIWRDGPCTPYAVRRHFLESRAPRWSGSAGSIYPLVRRLEARGLVASHRGARGQRAHRDYRITPQGSRILRQWLATPLDQTQATIVDDPLRTRMFFVAALSKKTALNWVADSLVTLRRELKLLTRDGRTNAEKKCPFSNLAIKNARLLTRARIRWLLEVQAALRQLKQH